MGIPPAAPIPKLLPPTDEEEAAADRRAAAAAVEEKPADEVGAEGSIRCLYVPIMEWGSGEWG